MKIYDLIDFRTIYKEDDITHCDIYLKDEYITLIHKVYDVFKVSLKHDDIEIVLFFLFDMPLIRIKADAEVNKETLYNLCESVFNLDI